MMLIVLHGEEALRLIMFWLFGVGSVVVAVVIWALIRYDKRREQSKGYSNKKVDD